MEVGHILLFGLHRLTLFSASISGCINTLREPQFGATDILNLPPPYESPDRSSTTLCEGFKDIMKLLPKNSHLIGVMLELQHLSNILTNNELVDSLPFLRVNEQLQYYIVMFESSTQHNVGSSLENVCRIGLQLFLKSTYEGYLQNVTGNLPSQDLVNGRIFQNLTSSLESLSTSLATSDLFLWLLFLCCITTTDPAWYIDRLSKAISEWDMLSWKVMKMSLTKFLWVDSILETSCREAWDEAVVKLAS